MKPTPRSADNSVAAGNHTSAAPTGSHPAALDVDCIRRSVEDVLQSFLDEKLRDLPHPSARPLVGHLRTLINAGGKRTRPVLCVVGWHAAGRSGTPPPLLHLAAAIEMFHAAAMIHDDIIDRSATRRGHPSAHHALRAHCAAPPESDISSWFGASAALILGDLALSWSDQLLYRGQLDLVQLQATHPLLDTLRTEALIGCYIELLATGHHSDNLETPVEINKLKSAKYTIERPLQLGAVLGGAGAEVLDTCTAYGIPLGEAFQLRDDILGVFGDTAVTGKPALDDLREGKPTLLLAIALSRADPGQRELLHRFVGNPSLDHSTAAKIREVLTATGARQEVEHRIEAQRLTAVAALHRSDLPAAVVTALHHMAKAVTRHSA
ncbi:MULTISPECIES: polyprenyl synthetase family protein [unclassified Streptomyces]|uniref:polyprenyl synthetase family protein n=1 Tax=unclassified Streptomyces TaxID=2593676 RepID=UPI002E1094D7|nr:polyprenyl synthetase family protein [Streptomyces sp. NBC_01197]WSS49060.1 polyprenyl synthetase family protein [Streptomyces sp. NBC_01180]